MYSLSIEHFFSISFGMSFTDINHFSISLGFSYWNITGSVSARLLWLLLL